MPSDKSVSDSCITQLTNCYILRNHAFIREDLWIRNGKILNAEKLFYDECGYADVQINCGGALVSPGFIETQINGAFGVDFSYDTEHVAEGVQRVAQGMLDHGVTSFCPTLITSPPDMYRKILPHIQRSAGGPEGAGVLGLHLEGPFISKEKKGAHPEQYISGFENGLSDIVNMYGSLDEVSIITLAPEKKGASQVIQDLVNKGITVSLGHSVADLQQGEEAVHYGASFITHLFNAMLPFHHRDPHLVGLLASENLPADRTVYFGLIADGIHTHPAAVRIANRVHPEGLVLVTDAVPAMGLGLGKHHIGKQKVDVRETGAYIADTNTLCGSTTSMNECVKNFYKMANSSRVAAVEAATLHPAQTLKISDRKGTLDYDSDADFVVMDDDLNVMATFIAGEKVWEKDGNCGLKYSHIVP